MNEKNTTDSWIHIETFNETHSWKQTWMFLGGAMVLFAFALLYEIDKDLHCKPKQASINSQVLTSPSPSQGKAITINSDILPGQIQLVSLKI